MNKHTKKHTQSKKKIYRISNWAQYNESLKQRGSLEVWMSPDIQRAWYAQPTGKNGAPEIYSDGAITCVLSIRKLFRLPLRQTQGFVRSAFKQSNTLLKAPDYTTISRRSGHLLVKLPKKDKEKTIIVVDSTGVKVYGEGEWKVRQHGKSKRRKWKKVHIAIDDKGEVRAADVTDEGTSDADMTQSLLNQEEAQITDFFGDGGYDQRKVYEECQKRKVSHMLIPPRKNAVIWQHGNRKASPHPRDEALRAIRNSGRGRWKEESGYHQRSLIENTMFRFKTIFGDRLLSREDSRQTTEIKLGLSLLNRMFDLGRPESYAVTA